MDNTKLLTLEEAAERLGMKVVTIRMWAATRRIGRCKIGRAVRIPETEIDRIIESSMIPARPER